MKQFLTLIFFSFVALHINAQKNRISIFYGYAGNEIVRSADLVGAPSFNGKGADIYGITYQRVLSDLFSVETGLEYSRNNIEVTPSFYPGIDMTPRKIRIEMLTFPIYAKITFLKYFYANGGALIDLEINRDDYQGTDDQSGIGFGAGIGGSYNFRNFTIFINPMLRYHAVIPFNKENYQQHLTQAGVKFGVGYNF